MMHPHALIPIACAVTTSQSLRTSYSGEASAQWTPQLDPAARQQPGTSTSGRNDSHRMPVPQLERRHGSQVSLDDSVTDAASSAGEVVCICLGEHCQYLPPSLHDCALHAMHILRPDTCCISGSLPLCSRRQQQQAWQPPCSPIASRMPTAWTAWAAHPGPLQTRLGWTPPGAVPLQGDMALAACRPG